MTGAPRALFVVSGPDEPAAPYVEALRACGADGAGLRVLASDQHDAASARALVAGAAGVVFCGGVDVAPERYGESARPGAGVETDRARDAFEFDLLAAAQAAAVPVLGICRGLQTLNVFLGGTLHQDLPSERPDGVRHAAPPQAALAHVVFVEDARHPFAELLRRETCVVNSMHHQGIKRLAAALVPIATSADDLVEAAATPPDHRWWVRGVQWHPEDLVELDLQRALWETFLVAAQSNGRRA